MAGESVQCGLQIDATGRVTSIAIYRCLAFVFVLMHVPPVGFPASSTTGFTHVPSDARDEPIFL